MDTYAGRSKYDEPGRAARYRERSPRRNEAEWKLLARVLDRLETPPSSALDVPCGTGRVAAQLLARGIPTRCADLSPAMRAETEARLADVPGFQGVTNVDLEAAADAGVAPADLVICFRFLHHLPSPVHRAKVLASLRALTGRDLLLSFHHPVSFHNLERKAKLLLRRKKGDRYTLWPSVLEKEAAAAGLKLVGFATLARWRRELWVAHLRPESLHSANS